MNTNYLVTFKVARGKSLETLESRFWDSRFPLPVGYPASWMLESRENSLRLRKLAHGSDEKSEFKEVSVRKGGSEIQVEERLALSIRRLDEMHPAYLEKHALHHSAEASLLYVFSCLGNSILDAVPFGKKFKSATGAFTLKHSSDGYLLLSHAPDLHYNDKPVASGEKITIPNSDISQATIVAGAHSWHLSMVSRQPPRPPSHTIPVDLETLWFRKALRGCCVALGALIALSWFWPQPDKTEELVPPQFAKIVMSAQRPAAQAAPAQSVAQDATPDTVKDAPAAGKANKASVTQAFRAKALQNSVKGLLKGGMTKLLAESQILSGATSSAAARGLFQGNALQPMSKDAGKLENRNVKVASMGGGGAGGSKVGYGKGENAAVSGQGHAFVSMDMGGSSVEEGLTKDEVGEVIHRHLSEIRYCYESAMLKQADIEGKLMIDFTIGGNGVVKSSAIKSSTIPDPRLDDCVLRRLATWQFPHPKMGVNVAVSYPFIFKTLGR